MERVDNQTRKRLFRVEIGRGGTERADEGNGLAAAVVEFNQIPSDIIQMEGHPGCSHPRK